MRREVVAIAAAVALLILLAAPEAWAQKAAGVGVGAGGTGASTLGKPGDDKWHWTLGGGAAVSPDYEGSNDYRGSLFPLVRAQKGPIYGQLGPGRGGLNLETNLIPSPNWRLGPLAQLYPGQRDVKDKRVDKIHSGGTAAFNLGVSGGYDFRFSGGKVLGLTVLAPFDVSGVYDGYQIIPEVEYRMPLGKRWSMRLVGSGAYASGGYMSEYFGIDQKDSQRSGLDEYNADAAFKDAAFGATFGYSITDNWLLNFGGTYKRLFGDAKDSPVTDDRGSANQLIGSVAVSYTW
jgi:outer membrane scaffolding protein for murein synthesis (MipA/OmpV family)